MERYSSELNRQRVTDANQELNTERLQRRITQGEGQLTGLKTENSRLKAGLLRLKTENAMLKKLLGNQKNANTPVTDQDPFNNGVYTLEILQKIPKTFK
ncbi:hypothetical protein A2111_02485 [Candidatus Daviesbacteria bacterium GWA1_38_6]|nr:MAG: hypothetical protein A2111_02485 [Candidatus Daviesbacteria bacterium GWA1_38_6]